VKGLVKEGLLSTHSPHANGTVVMTPSELVLANVDGAAKRIVAIEQLKKSREEFTRPAERRGG